MVIKQLQLYLSEEERLLQAQLAVLIGLNTCKQDELAATNELNRDEDAFLSNKGVANIKASSSSVEATFRSNQACFKYEIAAPGTVFITKRFAGQAQRDVLRHRRRWTPPGLLRILVHKKKLSAPLKSLFTSSCLWKLHIGAGRTCACKPQQRSLPSKEKTAKSLQSEALASLIGG